jgi:heptosyltransferase-2
MPAEATKTPDKILLILIGRLGDYIATTPFLAGLREKYPSASITLITSAKARNLASTNRDIDRLVIFKGWHDLPGTLRVFAAAMRKYDLAIDLNPAYSRTSLRLIGLGKAAARLAFRKKAPEGAYTCLIDHDLAGEHMLDKYVNLAARLGFKPPENMRFTLSEKTLLKGERLFKALGLPPGNFVVAVHPGNFKKTENRWPENKFVEFTKEVLKREDTSVFYLAGPGEEKRIAQTILPFLPGIKLVPPAPEEVTAAVLKHASILVCNNTGTLHLAAAAGVPTFSFNRPYTAKCWKPRGPDHFFITSTDEKSCRDIGVKEALEAFSPAVETLKARSAARQRPGA